MKNFELLKNFEFLKFFELLKIFEYSRVSNESTGTLKKTRPKIQAVRNFFPVLSMETQDFGQRYFYSSPPIVPQNFNFSISILKFRMQIRAGQMNSIKILKMPGVLPTAFYCNFYDVAILIHLFWLKASVLTNEVFDFFQNFS